MTKKLNKRILLIPAAVIILLVGIILWAFWYVGGPSDTLTMKADRRRYSYDVSITPRKAIQGRPVDVTMLVRDRVTKRPAAGVKFNVEMDKYHKFFAQSPSGYFEQELSTDENGIIRYHFVPNIEVSSEGSLEFSASPSIYRVDGVHVDPDEAEYPQYEKEDIAMDAQIQVLPPIAGIFRR